MNLFKNSALKTQYKLDWKNIKPIAEKMVSIQEQHHLEYNGVTSFKNRIPTHTLIELKPYYDFLKPIYTDYIFNTLGYPNDGELVIHNAWFSRYTKDGFVNEHDHIESLAVACLYIELPKNGGNIEFKDPYYNIKKRNSFSTDDSWLWNELEVNQEDVILFDATLPHRSQPNNSNEERWTLTTNIGFKKPLL